MDRIILWALFIIGIVLIIFGLRKPFIKDWILVFLIKAYFSTFIGNLVVENEMLKYPVRFLSEYFKSSILYEYILLPVVCIYFYQTTYHSRFVNIILQCVLYSAALTITEVILEKYTNLIEYLTWTWIHTFLSTFFIMIFVRTLMYLINKRDNQSSGTFI
ncbi:CBO0543 family protein [Bacillus sp. FJAT-29790]|uniref:CBO0543 family protein n=1 Tax=Bacillus sp. FJAT-29790 TaxID=1895002 RepID=UPI0020B32517|nr:CBO0543 family protein [Bacillus sp. FJAT-29790]